MSKPPYCDQNIVEISPSDIEKIQQLYTLTQPNYVLQFLETNPFLVKILLTAPEKINQYFPGDRLVLKVHFDPGSAEDDAELFIIIITKIECHEAVERLWKLDEDWSLLICKQARHKLEIHLG
ncbi:MAG: hypothetical protein WBA93_20185 [Microcoleaceae cyanobacterium]